MTALGCGRLRFDLHDAGPIGGVDVGAGVDDADVGRDVGTADAGPMLDLGSTMSGPTLTNAEDEVFWSSGGSGETVTAEGSGYVDGESTLYISADAVLDAADIAQATSFVSGTELTFVVNRGALPQGAIFLFVTNDSDLSEVDPSLTSDALAISVGRLWTPADVAGVAGWWDASDASTLFEADADPAEPGDGVFRWLDLSGNGHHLNRIDSSPPVTGISTVGSAGRNALDFNGAHELQTPPTPALLLDATGGVNMFSVVHSRGYVNRGSA